MMSKPLPKAAILVVNAHSRKGRDAFAEARDKLTAAGVELIESARGSTFRSMAKCRRGPR